jgi:CHAT domain-containing protein
MLDRLVTGYRRALALGRDDPTVARLGRELFDAVVAPVLPHVGTARLLAIVPDGNLHALPFATLQGTDGRFLVERFEVVVAPNTEAFLHSSANLARQSGPPRSVLVIGDPAFDRARFPALTRLPGARQEAQAVAGYYQTARTALADAATTDVLRRSAARADVIHFAGHAVENRKYPWRSALVLASAPSDEGLVYAEDIGRWRLDRVRVVALAACDTGTGRIYRGEGVVSLATPFLAAGVPAVVGTLWAVDDRAARRLFEHFHRSLSAGDPPSRALREAQLAMIAAGPEFNAPRQWGAYLLVGGTIQP